jgi:hypothetical protein
MLIVVLLEVKLRWIYQKGDNVSIEVHNVNSKDLCEKICKECKLEVEFGKNIEGTDIKNGGFVACHFSMSEWLRFVANRINVTG